MTDRLASGEELPAGITLEQKSWGVLHLRCKCGAEAFLSERKRFLRRHPSLCTARREFAKKLAATTRHLDDLEVNREV